MLMFKFQVRISFEMFITLLYNRLVVKEILGKLQHLSSSEAEAISRPRRSFGGATFGLSLFAMLACEATKNTEKF